MYALYGHIQYTKVADYLWQNITIDFIVKLLKLEDLTISTKYDSILIIVDKFTKYIYLISYNKKFTVK